MIFLLLIKKKKKKFLCTWVCPLIFSEFRSKSLDLPDAGIGVSFCCGSEM
jgi:hypothetical protein